MVKTVLKMAGIKKVYGDKVKQTVLKGVDLEIKEGDFVTIVGQSGSGKSTLVNIMSTLDFATEGKLEINGQEISDIQKCDELRNNEIGFIFQQHHLLPQFNVLDNVLMPAYIESNKVERSKKGKAIELLKDVGLEDVLKKNVDQLSGGQKQRVAIARSLINEPSILFADEPTGSLDSENSDKTIKLLQKISEKYNATIIIITHDLGIAKLGKRKFEVKNGHAIEY